MESSGKYIQFNETNFDKICVPCRYYILFEQLLKYNKKEDGSSGFKITAQDANWEKVTKQKHEQKIKAKRLEV